MSDDTINRAPQRALTDEQCADELDRLAALRLDSIGADVWQEALSRGARALRAAPPTPPQGEREFARLAVVCRCGHPWPCDEGTGCRWSAPTPVRVSQQMVEAGLAQWEKVSPSLTRDNSEMARLLRRHIVENILTAALAAQEGK